jgi:DNA-dependent protein kinase catalytic subunit
MSGNEGMVKIEVREIQEKISNPMLDKFVEALEITVVPEKLFHSEFLKFLTKLTDRMSNRDFGEEYTKFIFNAFEKNLEMKGNEYEKLQKFKKEIEYVKEMKWETERDQIKSQLRKVQKLTEAHLSQSSMRVMRNIETRKLSKFFENYKWNGGNNFIEIPGQYSGDFKPFVEKNVKVVRFGDKMKIFSSKQHPIEMKIHGSDGKTYSFIVKYGEDLRQDQRIQQVLELMSKKLALDKNCKQNRLQIQTYNVIPINSNCGIMSVVNNAITLTEFLDEACHLVIGRTYSSMDYKIRDEFRSFLAADLATTKSSVEIYRHAVKNFSRGELIEELSRQERRINLDVFQQWIMHSSLSFEAHYILRKNLITSLCVMNVAHWILGIGDRHLGNTLINKSNGSLIGIDFGISFDTGVHLEVPELVPCRLTSHFIYVIEPLGIEGIVRRNMIHALRCLRSHKETILICLEMFVKEPTIDWLIRSKQINDPKRKVIWNPEQRIENVKQKLSGANPMKIILDELSFSTIPRDNELHRCYQSLIHGEIDSKRSKMGSYNLSPEDQITAVIEMATDKALLATIWLGWDPWI